MSEDDLRERWPSADRAAMIDDDGNVHGFDRSDDDDSSDDEEVTNDSDIDPATNGGDTNA